MTQPSYDQQLQRRLRALEIRASRLERLVVRVIGTLALGGLVLSLALPFFTASDVSESSDESPHLWLIQAVFALPAAGGGPFSGDAALAGVLLGLLLAATVFAIVAVAAYTFNERPVRGWHRAAVILVSLGTAGAWVLTLALTAHFDSAGGLIGAGLIAHTLGCAFAGATIGAKSTFG